MKKIVLSLLLLSTQIISAMDSLLEEADLPLVKSFTFPAPRAACYVAGGQHLAVGSSDLKFSIINTHDVNQRITIKVPYDAHPISVNQKGIGVAVGSAFAPIGIWNYMNGQKLADLGGTEGASSLSYHQAGNSLVVTTDTGCAVWDLYQNKISHQLNAQRSWASQWNPSDNNLLACVSGLDSSHDLLITWDVRSDSPVQKTATQVPINLVAYTPSGEELVCAAPWQYVTYDSRMALLRAYFDLYGKNQSKDPIYYDKNQADKSADSLQCIPTKKGTFIAGLDTGEIVVCNIWDDTQSFHFKASPKYDDIDALAINADGTRCAAGLIEGNCVKIWDISNINEERIFACQPETDNEILTRVRTRVVPERRGQVGNSASTAPSLASDSALVATKPGTCNLY